ncbi:hypothetical protein PIROE2DRAFT_7651 [Piromyces sp. E2]|nr:hypothetical protein PIROE2DRAFT_7651 [Piromyces sp. E2]|eukprot:OUM65352.1 hypothetical protein PIROE2DRAFT_7651 [Piromyces sp. E2]
MANSVTLSNSSSDFDVSTSLSSSLSNDLDHTFDTGSSLLLFCKDPLEKLNFNKNNKVAEKLLVDHTISNSKPCSVNEEEERKQVTSQKSTQDNKGRYYSLFESDSIKNNFDHIFDSFNINNTEKMNQSFLSSSSGPNEINTDFYMNPEKFILPNPIYSSNQSITKDSFIEKPNLLNQGSDLSTLPVPNMKKDLSSSSPIIRNDFNSSLKQEFLTHEFNDISLSMNSLNLTGKIKHRNNPQSTDRNYSDITDKIFKNNSVHPQYTTSDLLPYKNSNSLNSSASSELSYSNHNYFSKRTNFDIDMVPSIHEKLNIHYPISLFKEMKKDTNRKEDLDTNDNDTFNNVSFMNKNFLLTNNNVTNTLNKYDERKLNCHYFSSQTLSLNTNINENNTKCSSTDHLKLSDLSIEDDEEEYYIYKSSTGGFYRCKSKYKNYHNSINNNNNYNNNNNNNELNQTSYLNSQNINGTQSNDYYKSPSQKYAEIVNLSRKSITLGNFTQIFKKDILVCSICSSCPKQFGLLTECDHVFCLDCIKIWRRTDSVSRELTRKCPICQKVSLHFIPSDIYCHSGPLKNHIIERFRSRCSRIPCRFYEKKGPNHTHSCPFGNECLFLHRNPDGSNEKFKNLIIPTTTTENNFTNINTIGNTCHTLYNYKNHLPYDNNKKNDFFNIDSFSSKNEKQTLTNTSSKENNFYNQNKPKNYYHSNNDLFKENNQTSTTINKLYNANIKNFCLVN